MPAPRTIKPIGNVPASHRIIDIITSSAKKNLIRFFPLNRDIGDYFRRATEPRRSHTNTIYFAAVPGGHDLLSGLPAVYHPGARAVVRVRSVLGGLRYEHILVGART